MIVKQFCGQWGLAFAGFDQQVASWGKPLCPLGRHPALYLQAIGSAVKAHTRLVQSCFGRHHVNVAGGNVRSIAQQNLDPATEPIRQWIEEIALVQASTQWTNIAARALDSGRLDIGSVQLDPARRSIQRGTQRTAPTAKVEYHRSRGSKCGRHADEELRSAPGNKDTRSDGNPQPTEIHPPQNVLEWVATRTRRDHFGEFTGGSCCGDQQLCFFLGEDATGGPQLTGNLSPGTASWND